MSTNLPDVANRDLEENVLAANAAPVTDRFTDGVSMNQQHTNDGSVRASA